MNEYPKYPYYSETTECDVQKLSFPPQQQEQQPGLEYVMTPRPIYENPSYLGSEKLKGRVAIITGGDSGIGRAAAIAFAKEGADVVIAYLYEEQDAQETKQRIEQLGRRCLALKIDLRAKANCSAVVAETIRCFSRLDILVNNIAVQYPQENLIDISEAQLEQTFRTNFYSYVFMTQAALTYLKQGSSIINTSSVTAYRGEKTLIDYSATKGAITSFTRSLALSLAEQDIRVNGVAPGPIWTPLIPASFPPDKVARFGTDTPLERAGQPFELAPTYVYLASDDSRYVTGQMLHVNGGGFVGG